MIKRVTLKNFQSHSDSTFEFCPTTNSIVGSSNNGKTVVLRAISWVVTNRPSADALISHWANDEKGNQKDDMIVTVETDDHIISRIKSKKGNYYVIDGKTLEAVGRDVPQDISDALNMSEVNIQKQMDAPFLLSDSPGEVARFFNKIVKLDKIDTFLTAIESKKRKTRDELDNTRVNFNKIETEIHAYDWIAKAEKLLDKISELESSYNILLSETNSLNTALSAYVENSQRIEEIDIVVSHACAIMDRATTLLAESSQLTSEKYALKQTITTYETHNAILNSDIPIEYAEKIIAYIHKLNEKIASESPAVLNLKKDIGAIKSLLIEGIDDEINELEASLPSICPLCGGNIEDHSHS